MTHAAACPLMASQSGKLGRLSHRPVRSFVTIVIHQIYRLCASQHICYCHDSKQETAAHEDDLQHIKQNIYYRSDIYQLANKRCRLCMCCQWDYHVELQMSLRRNNPQFFQLPSLQHVCQLQLKTQKVRRHEVAF